MVSDSARATTAAEARFRIAAPNARPRAIAVVALDEATARLAADLAREPWSRVDFYTMSADGDLRTLEGERVHRDELIARVDIVQMLLTAGAISEQARRFGEACLARGVKTSGIVIDEANVGGEALTRSLQGLRASVMTLSVVCAASDVNEVLSALVPRTESFER